MRRFIRQWLWPALLRGIVHHCPYLFCIMSSHAYDPQRHLCPGHLRPLKANGGLFQYLASPGINGG